MIWERCKVCGWPENAGIHLPVIDGPRKGEPWGHAFVPPAPDTPKEPVACEPGNEQRTDRVDEVQR